MDLDKARRTYARAIVEGGKTSYEAALLAFPDDPGAAFRASRDWEYSEEITTIKREIAEEVSEAEFSPPHSRTAFLENVWERMQRCSSKDYAKIAAVYGQIAFPELRETAGKKTTTETETTTRKVLAYRDLGTTEEWAANTKAGQLDLIARGAEIAANSTQAQTH